MRKLSVRRAYRYVRDVGRQSEEESVRWTRARALQARIASGDDGPIVRDSYMFVVSEVLVIHCERMMSPFAPPTTSSW